MNIFFLDIDPQKNAEYNCDKHVVKMILEIVQLLYSAHHFLGSIPGITLPQDHYKMISNPKHPLAIWVTICFENYSYAAKIAIALAREYTYRYFRIHACEKHALWLHDNIPNFSKPKDYSSTVVFGNIPELQGITPIPLCMPVDSMLPPGVIKSYRQYYLLHKKHFAKWSGRNIPYWFTYSDIRSYF